MLHALADASDPREIWWCYGAHNGSEHPFAEESRELLHRLPHGHSFIAYSEPEDRDQQGKDYDVKGRLNLSLLERLQVPPAADFYLCGPPAFLTELTAGLKSWGVPYSRIHSETFGTESAITPGIAAAPAKAPHPPAGPPGPGPLVTFTRSGLVSPLESQLSNPSSIRGGLRCSRQMVVPGGCVPHVRVGLDRWRGWLCSRAARPAGCGKYFTVLFVAGGRDRLRSMTRKETADLSTALPFVISTGA